jgi:hypothetical protein
MVSLATTVSSGVFIPESVRAEQWAAVSPAGTVETAACTWDHDSSHTLD